MSVDIQLHLAYGQVKAAAVLRGQEVRQFSESGINIIEELRKKLSEANNELLTTGDVFDYISARKVPFEMVRDILMEMTSAGGKFYLEATPHIFDKTKYGLAEVVINQTARLGDGRAITVQLQQVLDRFVTGEPGRPLKLIHMGDIPADLSVRQAIMRRQLLLQSTPGCPAAMAISQLALKIQEVVIPR